MKMIDVDSASDAALVVAIGRYHDRALAEVYRRHGGAVWALAKRIVRSDALADDITQDVFLRLWHQPEGFDASRARLRTYLNAMTHNRAVDVLRSESSRAAREERSTRETALAGYGVERHSWDLAMADHVQTALDELPPAERDAIHLAYFDGHTYREVASLLGEPEGTVKSRIRSGLKRMRASLARQQSEPTWTTP